MRMGVDPAGLVCSRMTFTGKDVREGYDTTQVFDDKYPHGAFSYLSHWHLKGTNTRRMFRSGYAPHAG